MRQALSVPLLCVCVCVCVCECMYAHVVRWFRAPDDLSNFVPLPPVFSFSFCVPFERLPASHDCHMTSLVDDESQSACACVSARSC